MTVLTDKIEMSIFHQAFDRGRSYKVYAELRSERPLTWLEDALGGASWLATRYDDVMTILKDSRFVKDIRNVLEPEQRAQLRPLTEAERILTRSMLFLDPPDHTRLRALVSKGFSSQAIDALRDRVQAIADELLDGVQNRGEMDLITDYAYPLPLRVIAEMLGAPAADYARFRAWSEMATTPSYTEEARIQLLASLEDFIAYIRAIIEERRTSPRDDLITALVQAEDEGGALLEEELCSMVLLLLVAGHETSVNLIANSVVALLQHPDQLAQLRNDPALTRTAVEEMLRYDGPVEVISRLAREDVVIDGTRIKKGECVFVALSGANHDPLWFDDSEALDIRRKQNRHLAFGQGIHYCVGAPLARMEGQIALDTLLRRMPRLNLAEPETPLRWKEGLILRGYTRVPVTF